MANENRQLEMVLAWYQACVNVVTVFGETEVGGAEANHDAIINYMSSIGFISDAFDAPTGDAAIEFFEEQLTQRILDGFPIWRFLKLSSWTMEMVEQSFDIECKAAEQKAEHTYCCLRCEYLRERGFAYYCDAPDARMKLRPREFSLKKRCKSFRRKK